MARDIDIVIESLGSNSFRPFGKANVDTKLYDQVKANRNLNRTLHLISCGAEEVNADVKGMRTELDKLTGGDLGRIGALCLYGTSNGAGFTLTLAKLLKGTAAPKPAYVGLGDLTLMPFGRKPPLDGIGDLKPVNDPELMFGLGVVTVGGHVPGLAPQVRRNRPRIDSPGIVADQLENYFTTEGNRARVSANRPGGTGWWWFSTQNFAEVHGEVDGWHSNERTTTSIGSTLVTGPGSVDEGHHDNLCGKAIKEMRVEAGIALGKFIVALGPPTSK